MRRRKAQRTALGPTGCFGDVSFAIDPGETVAIVGHTGAGEDHADLAPAAVFYDVQKGAVRIDGVDVKELDLCRLAQPLRGGAAKIRFCSAGRLAEHSAGTKRIMDADIEKAAEDVNLADFIRALPKGFGRRSSRARLDALHGTEAAHLVRARARPRTEDSDSSDEATSSVDTETEFRVRDALSRMVEGRTSLIIAHRLSTVQRADKIIVMHKGQLPRNGTHQQLPGAARDLLQALSVAV